MLPSIPEGHWQAEATDPLAWTRLLDLPGMRVTRLEYDAFQQIVLLLCQHETHHALCPTCGQVSEQVHQYRRRAVRDLPFGGRACLVEFDARRFFCPGCDCPFTESLDWLGAYSRLTTRYQQHLFACCRQTCLQAVSRQEGIGYKTLQRLYYAQAQKQTRALPTHPVRQLGMDEFALKKGYGQFAVAISDLQTGQVLAVLPDRKKQTLLDYFATWTPAQRAAVEEVALDLWDTYAQVSAACLPHAQRVADRFHVMKNLNDRVSEARRAIQRALSQTARQTLKGCRWLLVRNACDLSQSERTTLDQMFAVAPDLQRLHALKEQFRTLFESAQTPAEAAEQLERWIAEVHASHLPQLLSFVALLRKQWEAVLRYFHHRLTSGKVEGINTKIKLIKRCGYGYRNLEHFALRVQIECDGAT